VDETMRTDSWEVSVAERSVAEARNRPLSGGFGWYRFDAISLDGRYLLVASWYSGFLFSPRYYDEVLDLRDRKGTQPGEGVVLADPTNHGAFCLALYEHRRTAASVVVESSLVRGGSDPWFPKLHFGETGLGDGLPEVGTTLGVGENRVVRQKDGSYAIDFSDRSRWTRSLVEGALTIRPLTGGSDIITLTTRGEAETTVRHEWQILASRTEVKGSIAWTERITRRRRKVDFQGLGYVDRNAGCLPISPGVGRWLWGRFQGSERTIAYWRLDPAAAPFGAKLSGAHPTVPSLAPGEFLYHGDRSGGELAEGARIQPARIRRNRWGMPHPLEIHGTGGGLAWRSQMLRVVDRGPFYVRCLSRLSCEDEALDGVVGITECFLPARWDVPLYRLLARGRVRRGP
jgi:hypothetical protein